MTRPIDGQLSLAQIPNIQQMQLAAQREAELAEQRQRLAAQRAQEAEKERVQRDEAVLGKTIREDDPRGERRQQEKPEPPPRPQQGEPPAHVDIVL